MVKQQTDTEGKKSQTAINFPKDKEHCDQPAYLFWKLQSRLTKLNNRLTNKKQKAT
jgi:hypothetical protein